MHIAQLRSIGIITSLFKLYQAKEAATDTVFQVNRSKSSQGRGRQGKARQASASIGKATCLSAIRKQEREPTWIKLSIRKAATIIQYSGALFIGRLMCFSLVGVYNTSVLACYEDSSF